MPKSHVVPARRHFPQDVVSVGARLAQLEIRGADFVRRSETKKTTQKRLQRGKQVETRTAASVGIALFSSCSSGCVSFRVREFFLSFRRIDFFDRHGVVLEQVFGKTSRSIPNAGRWSSRGEPRRALRPTQANALRSVLRRTPDARRSRIRPGRTIGRSGMSPSLATNFSPNCLAISVVGAASNRCSSRNGSPNEERSTSRPCCRN